MVTATENVKEDIQPQRNPKKVRKVCSVPKTFKISLDKNKWRSIKPTIGSVKLRKPWTHVTYEEFNKVNPNCVLAFKYQNARLMHSRKIKVCLFKQPCSLHISNVQSSVHLSDDEKTHNHAENSFHDCLSPWTNLPFKRTHSKTPGIQCP